MVGFPRREPEWVSLVDVGAHSIETFSRLEFDALRTRLGGFEVIAGMEIRSMLQALGFDPEERWLGELGPPQKTMRLNGAGRTLKLTTELLVRGSCRIASPLGDEKRMVGYLKRREEGKLQRRLESDAKALAVLYAYGRLHGIVRVRWGFGDERLPAPWVHRDERVLRDLAGTAQAMQVPLEVVVGSAPGWESPWAQAIQVQVVTDVHHSWRKWLLDEQGEVVEEADVQAARLGVEVH